MSLTKSRCFARAVALIFVAAKCGLCAAGFGPAQLTTETQTNQLGIAASINGKLLYEVTDEHKLWAYNSATSTNELLSSSTSLDTYYGVRFMKYRRNAYIEGLLKTDGTAGGTQSLGGCVVTDPPGANMPQFAAGFGDYLYFTGSSSHGNELWRTDNTLSGTLEYADIYPGYNSYTYCTQTCGGFPPAACCQWATAYAPNDGCAPPFTVLAHKLLFFGASTNKVWRLDSNGALTSFGGTAIGGGRWVRLHDKVYSLVYSGGNLVSLMSCDGSNLDNIYTFNPGADLHSLRVADNGMYFSATEFSSGAELWFSDGTTAGTHLCTDLVPGSGSSTPLEIVTIGSRAFFSATTPATGREFFVSDGTQSGTHLLKDIYPGTGSSDILNSRKVAGNLFFSAIDPSHGRELWVSDGTEQGTQLFQDVVPGTGSADPSHVEVAGSKAYFTVDKLDGGPRNTQLWSFDVPSANLKALKIVSAEAATVGDNLTYTMGVINNGPETAYGVRLTDELPEGCTFISAAESTGTHTVSNELVVFDTGTIDPGGSAQMQIIAQASAPGQLVNLATVSSDSNDPDASDDVATATTSVSAPPADLSITKTAPTTGTVNKNLTYSITVTNNSGEAAYNVRVMDPLPGNCIFVGASEGQGSHMLSAGTVTFYAGIIQGNSSVQMQIVVTPTAAGNLVNSASVVSGSPDPDTANNEASAQTEIQPAAQQELADVSIGISTLTLVTTIGLDLTYTLYVHNNGPGIAYGVVARDPLPAGCLLVSAGQSSGTPSISGNMVTFHLGNLASGQSDDTCYIVVRPTAAGLLENTASVSTVSNDQGSSNNQYTSQVFVNAPQADLQLSKIVSASTTTVGQNLSYTISVQNNGPEIALNTRVVDSLPAGCTLLDVDQTLGSNAVTTEGLVFSLGDIAAGSSVQIHVVVATTEAGLLTNSAVATSDSTDPHPENSSASAVTDVNEPPGYGPCPHVRISFTVDAQGKCKGDGAQIACKVKGRVLLANLTTSTLPVKKMPVCFYLSSDAVLDSGDTLIRRRSLKAPKPGKTKTGKLSASLSSGIDAAGKYVIAVADCDVPLVTPCDYDLRAAASGPIPSE